MYKQYIMQKQSRQHKHRVLSRKQKQNQKRNGGGCNCIFSGGSAVVGTTPGLALLNNQSYYPVNSYNNDPNYNVVASRQTDAFLMKGGRKLKRRMSTAKRISKNGKKRVLKSRKIRGGSSSGTLVGNTIDMLKTVSDATVVGANSFNGVNTNLPYSRFINEYPPRA